MYADDIVAVPLTVVAFDDDCYFLVEVRHAGKSGGQPDGSRQREADMLVFGVAVEMACRRL